MMNGRALAAALQESPRIEEALRCWEVRERPLTEHTQRVSALYSRLTTLPPPARGFLLWLVGRSRWAVNQRERTALHVPTGAPYDRR